MKFLVFKTKKMLKKVILYEFEKFKLKVLFLNTCLPLEIRQKAYLQLQFLNIKFRKVRVQYRCILTNNVRFVIKFFKLSRFRLKVQFYKNYLVGLKKKSF